MAQLETAETKERRALSGWPMIIAWAGMLIFALHACTHMVAAGDTWVAMACGRHFINHGVDTVEPFSANSHKAGPTVEEIAKWPSWAQKIADTVGIETVRKWHPTGWVNQNWLTHVIFNFLVPKSSYADGLSFTSNALVYWKFAIYIIAIICVFYTGVIMGVNPALSAVFSCFALFIGRSFLDIRPAGFSNVLVAVFLLVLTLATYRNVLYIWLVVPITVFWCNVHGGYIYVFIILVPFVGIHLLATLPRKIGLILYNVTAWPFFYVVAMRSGSVTLPKFLFLLLIIVLEIVLIAWKDRIHCIGRRGLYHTIGAAAAAFVGMVLFNPFHLTNLTHTFVISVSEHAARWRDIHEWHPAFDWSNPVGTAKPFLVMYIISWVMLLLWIVFWLRVGSIAKRQPKKKAATNGVFELPKVDVAHMLIAAMTIYMAIRSRRFIPIAAVVACPVIALLLDQFIRMISAVLRLDWVGGLREARMPRELEWALTFVGAVAVLFFGTWWGLKFKRVYLDPWPADPSHKLSNVFMRMTASDAKPFYATRFIKDNKLSGKMFNYWTEGGFVAWGQEPDPETGKTPLQLFMDGRAQAAYNRPAFDTWTLIMSGGPPMREVYVRGRNATDDDYREAGEWIGEQLRAHDVWVTLMPAAQFNNNYVMSIEQNRQWRVVFMNNKQKMFVDCESPKGRELYDGVLTGETKFPDEFSRLLTIGHILLEYGTTIEDKKKGLDYSIEAFNLNQSPAPVLEIILTAARYIELRPQVTAFCEAWYKDFMDKRDEYRRQNGYRLKVESVRLACIHLQKIAEVQGVKATRDLYTSRINEFIRERNEMSRLKRW